MSIGVDLEELAATVEKYGSQGYLLTSSGGGAPHISAVAIRSQDGVLITGLGNSGRRAIEANPAVSLLLTPTDRRDYSLIVDGDAQADGEEARITPGRAVLHRAAPNPDPDGACGHDCKEL